MYRSILVGTDGSSTAAVAVDRAAALAATFDARLTIACVGPESSAAVVAAAEARRVAAVRPDAEALGRDGDPAAVLVELAEGGGYDLLVLGNKGMSGLSRFFAGSVPNTVSHRVHCALLVVRST